jgi:hypothetical protein
MEVNTDEKVIQDIISFLKDQSYKPDFKSWFKVSLHPTQEKIDSIIE